MHASHTIMQNIENQATYDPSVLTIQGILQIQMHHQNQHDINKKTNIKSFFFFFYYLSSNIRSIDMNDKIIKLL